MLRLEGLRASAGGFALTADWALDAPGRLAIVGPSGAGKSTLLDVIAGFRAPDTGQVHIAGQEVTQAAPAERGVAILFQDNNLFPHLTVAQTLALALRPRGGRLSAAEAARIDQALTEVDLVGYGDRRPAALSGGQQSRAALARVLVQEAPVWLLDEPFAALGPGLRAELLDRVHGAASTRGLLVCLVTHDPDDARRFADHVVFIEDGHAAAPVAAEAFFADPPDGYRTYLGQKPAT